MMDLIRSLFQHGTPASLYPGAAHAPLDYPGRRPAGSYLYFKGHIFPLDNPAAGVLTISTVNLEVDQLLSLIGGAPLRERYLVLAVGSNACPGRLQEKFGARFPEAALPVLAGAILDVDTVYCADLASYAAIPASCIAAPGTQLEGWALLVSAEELAWLNETEGIGVDYELVQLATAFQLASGAVQPVYAYAHHRLLILADTPVRLEEFQAAAPRFPARSQREILTQVLDDLQFLPEQALVERHRRLWQDSAQRQAILEQLVQRHGQNHLSSLPGPSVTMTEVIPSRW
jgi:hypothetical protein